MPRNPLLENMLSGKTSLGAWAQDPGTIRLMAHIGFDWVMIDMMFTSLTWDDVERLITTSEAAEITPVVRVQSNPWIGYDHRIAVDVSRAQGVGAQFILISNSCKKEIEECIGVSRDWHRRALVIHPFKGFGEWEPTISKMANETFIIPQPESKGGLEDLEETLAIEGVKAFFIGMTDASRVLTGGEKPDWNSPILWEQVGRAVKIGKEKGVMIGANTSYAYTMGEMAKRVKKLHDAGVKMIMIQGAPFLFQVAVGEFVNSVRKDLK